MPTLELKDLETAYGLSRVLFGISFTVQPGEVVCLLGRNGVGKSSTIRTVMGLNKPTGGSVRWNSLDIGGWTPTRICAAGIGFVPEDRRVFADLTVEENLDVARRPRAGGWDEDRVYNLFPDLREFRTRRGGLLSGGQQQMLTIGRSLMGNPDLLLLDEPSEGLAPLVVNQLRERIEQLKKTGLSIILAEQNLDFSLRLSDVVHILEKGQIQYTGTPGQLQAAPEVLDRYLRV